MKTYKVHFKDTPFQVNKKVVVSSQSSYSVDDRDNLRVGENLFNRDTWSFVEFLYDGGSMVEAANYPTNLDYPYNTVASVSSYYDESPNIQGTYSNG